MMKVILIRKQIKITMTKNINPPREEIFFYYKIAMMPYPMKLG
jgi:hypothetical protein